MSELKIENGVLLEIGEEVRRVTIPADVKQIETTALLLCYKAKAIDVEEGNENFCSVDGVLFTKDMKTLVKYPQEKKEAEYEIPQGVEVVGEYAFVCNDKIKRITMPDSVKKLCNHAFGSCGELVSVTFSANLEEIDEFAFHRCRELKMDSMPKSVKYIGRNAFSNTCLEVVVIPENVEVVDEYAFDYCLQLKRVFIKSNKTFLKKKVFCGNRSVKIYVPDDYPLEQCEAGRPKSLNKSCKNFWKEIIEDVEPFFRGYLESLKPISMENNVAIFTIPKGTLTEKVKVFQMFNGKYNHHVKELLMKATGEEWEVKVQ